MASRRQFLQKSSVFATGLVATSTFPAIIIPKQKQKLGIALVGLGYYSTDLLAPALQLTEHCSLTGIVTGTPSKADTWQKRHALSSKNIYDYQNFEKIANNDDIDVIYVVLPPALHAEYVIKAANAGKHVWCEKPMAMTEAECQQMIDACKRNKVNLSIGYRMHHEPNTKQVIQFRKDLTYGKVVKVTAAAGYTEGRTNHWKQVKKLGGGAMYDMGVYPLNAIRYATGMEPISVLAKQSTTRPEIYKEVDETMNFDLEFKNGVIAKGETSFGKGMNDLLVTCDKGWYSLSPFQAYNGVRGETSDGRKLNATIPNQQARQMDDDAQSIKNKTATLVPGEEGLKDIRIVEAIYKSVRLNERVRLA